MTPQSPSPLTEPQEEPATTAALNLIATAVCRPAPSVPHLFPYLLTDSRYADPNPTADGWTVWHNADTIEIVLMLRQHTKLHEVAVSLLQSLSDSLPPPAAVQTRWSTNGHTWSRWHTMHPPQLSHSANNERASVLYTYKPQSVRRPRFVALRILHSPSHSAAAPLSASRLMIDEVEISGQ